MTLPEDPNRTGRATRRRSRVRLAAVAATITCVVAGACGGDDTDATTASTAAPASTATTAAGAARTTAAPEAGSLPVDQMRATVDEAMRDMAVPGAVVLVASPEGEWLEAFGTREVGGTDAVTTEDHFRVGSNTKTMTGTVVLQLVQEGLLGLDDPVSKHYPGVPNGESITIAQLLSMSSGLQSYTLLESFNEAMDDEPSRAWNPEELVALGVAEPPSFPPGQEFEYSNTNTLLAALIAEKVTGKDVQTLFAERIFGPLALEDTVFPAITSAAIPEPYPRGYMFGTNVSTLETTALPDAERAAALAGTLKPGDYTDLNPSWGWAAGAAISTAKDLRTYVEALVGGGLLDPTLQRQRLDSVQPVKPGDPKSAGYGLALASFGPMLGHDGSLPGYQSFMGHDPTTDRTLIVLTNLQSAPDGQGTANVVAQRLLGGLYSGIDGTPAQSASGASD